MSDIRLHLDRAKLDYELNQVPGMVGRYLGKIGVKIHAGALAMVGKRTGALSRSLYTKQRRRGAYQELEVGATAAHAYMHHEGTRRHLIVPQNGRLLRFNVGGRVVYARRVLSPGTKPNQYLIVPMRKAVR